MNEREDELFEAELRRLKPTKLPSDLQLRLDSPPVVSSPHFERQPPMGTRRLAWPLLLRLEPRSGSNRA